MPERVIESACFIAPSTALSRSAKSMLDKTSRLLKRGLGVREVNLSPHLFSIDEEIDHVTAPAVERAAFFKQAIRENDLVVSVAGGTGAEDLAFKIDGKDYRVIRERRPLFMGFSDFTFLLSEIYYSARVPLVYFPSLKMGKGNLKKILSLIRGEEVVYRGSRWLTPPPKRSFSGIPIGGNLTTFVNFLNRRNPPRFDWRRHILFVEDIRIDVEDLHRLMAALSRHRVLERIKGIVVGSLDAYNRNHNYRKNQKDALTFIKNYTRDVIKSRRKNGRPLPILSVSNFGHNIVRDVMAVPIGGRATITKSKRIVFRLPR
jgi:muramoyltetrapeptide carboxypeptidase LdcA involved in peptidoglycan recycling